MNTLTSPVWWKAAALRGLRTAITIATPYFGAVALFHAVPWLSVASAAGLGFIASLVTSLAGIPEATGTKVPVWLALLERTVKTVAQGIAVGVGNTVLFQDVSWSHTLQAALLAGLGSLLIGVLGFLPESTDNPLAAEPVIVAQTIANQHEAPAIPAPADPAQPAAGVPPSEQFIPVAADTAGEPAVIDPPGHPVTNGI